LASPDRTNGLTQQMPVESVGEISRQLRDIHLPEPVSWWPLSLFTWASIAIVLLMLVMFVVFLLHRGYARKPSSIALSELDTCYSKWCNTECKVSYLQNCSAILKRLALSISKRKEVANLSGEAWVIWLNQQGTKSLTETTKHTLSTDCYTPSPAADIPQLHNDLVQWIKGIGN